MAASLLNCGEISTGWMVAIFGKLQSYIVEDRNTYMSSGETGKMHRGKLHQKRSFACEWHACHWI
jgi:hypothetical protein